MGRLVLQKPFFFFEFSLVRSILTAFPIEHNTFNQEGVFHACVAIFIMCLSARSTCAQVDPCLVTVYAIDRDMHNLKSKTFSTIIALLLLHSRSIGCDPTYHAQSQYCPISIGHLVFAIFASFLSIFVLHSTFTYNSTLCTNMNHIFI